MNVYALFFTFFCFNDVNNYEIRILKYKNY